jgi:hypothetical protein
MFLTNHASYFEHATIAILLTFAVGGWASGFAGRGKFFRICCLVATAFGSDWISETPPHEPRAG